MGDGFREGAGVGIDGGDSCSEHAQGVDVFGISNEKRVHCAVEGSQVLDLLLEGSPLGVELRQRPGEGIDPRSPTDKPPTGQLRDQSSRTERE
jgi:hypothetical protein